MRSFTQVRSLKLAPFHAQCTDTTRREDAFRNSSVNVPKNGCRGNSVNVKALSWFIIDSNDSNIY